MTDALEDPLPLVLTVEEAARELRIARGCAYEAVRTNQLPHVHIGRTIRIPRSRPLEFIEGRQPPETAAN